VTAAAINERRSKVVMASPPVAASKLSGCWHVSSVTAQHKTRLGLRKGSTDTLPGGAFMSEKDHDCRANGGDGTAGEALF
jgi:hypothetical protein